MHTFLALDASAPEITVKRSIIPLPDSALGVSVCILIGKDDVVF